MHLLLIRHGESVDNVAGLYAGTRDSPLTNHGVLQAKRLGAHLAKRGPSIGPIREIFSSHLQRARRTAEAIAEAQRPSSSDGERAETQPALLQVVQIPDLREKDFGSAEGKKFGARDRDKNVRSDAETRDAMRVRVDRFLDTHLNPVVNKYSSDKVAVAIVSHGIILNVLLKALLERYPPGSSSSHLGPNSRHDASSEYLATWNNTGVLQLKLELRAIDTKQPAGAAELSEMEPARAHQPRVHLAIEFTDNVDHLQGLKKTRGGIGSAQADSRQRTMDSFFSPALKKRKRDAPDER